MHPHILFGFICFCISTFICNSARAFPSVDLPPEHYNPLLSTQLLGDTFAGDAEYEDPKIYGEEMNGPNLMSKFYSGIPDEKFNYEEIFSYLIEDEIGLTEEDEPLYNPEMGFILPDFEDIELEILDGELGTFFSVPDMPSELSDKFEPYPDTD
ncbi:hypothetical protein Aperf_G00000093197 [Anoplocephala perfoliata]